MEKGNQGKQEKQRRQNKQRKHMKHIKQSQQSKQMKAGYTLEASFWMPLVCMMTIGFCMVIVALYEKTKECAQELSEMKPNEAILLPELGENIWNQKERILVTDEIRMESVALDILERGGN